MLWLESHVGSIEKCIEIANEYFWDIVVFEGSDGKWYVKSGETIIFNADTREAIDSFLYGIGLAYNGIPEHLFKQLIEDSKKLFF